ncbi:MAG TPA: carboxypeptidase regulatory-like domain-containing protein [Pyrinomonadaceae bacterium]|nr:carboxypeptidase regulatory-like domain-containing protein [Pyrinomonadaceae bacterium]
MRSRFRAFAHISCAIVFVFVALLMPMSVSSQESRGKISGRVTDPNGAAVPGATVKITDLARAGTTTVTTNDAGLFDAPYLLPGTYQVLVETTGFKKAVLDKVSVAINETSTVTITLDVGTVQETVTVTSDTTQLNQSDPNLGMTIDRKRVDELPSIHGDPYVLINLAPGVTYTGSTRLDRPFEPTHIANFAMGGARGIRSDLLIDGAPSTATANANEVIASYVPTSDATQEFRVQTATYDAQFGNTEGGVTSIVTKGGANDFHGTVYYWLEPGGWAANDFFGNAQGQGRPYSFSNRPGFSVGGPITIPKVYSGKNKSFFFFSYESIDDSRPRFDANNIWVPTEALKNGDFSAYANVIKIYDPLTGTFSGGNVTNRTQFLNNKIPADRISPVAKAVMSYWGAPKHGAQGNFLLNNNIRDSTLSELLDPPYRNYTIRIDQSIGDKDKVFGRYSWYNRKSTYNNYTNSIYVGDRFVFQSRQAVLDEVHTFNANTVLNLRYGFNRFIRAPDAPEGQYGMDLTTLGFPASFNNAIGEGVRRFPRFDFNCSGNCTGAPVGNGHTNEFRPVSSHFATAVLNWTKDKHSFRFGGEMRIYREDDSFKSNNQSGHFIFDNTFTRQGSAASTDVEGLQGFASFLLGYPTTMQIVRASDYSEYSKTWGFFVQDDFRLTNKLTLNLGLRWEFEQALTERQNKSVSGFDFAYTQPFEAQAQANLTAILSKLPANDPLKATFGLTSISARGGLLFAGKDTGSGLYSTPKDGFLPRVGFAYALNEKTVIRGGFGLFQGFLGERRGDVIQPGYTQTTIQPLTTGPNGAPLPVLITNPFPSGITEPSGNALGRQTALGQTISFFNQDPKVAKQARWSLGVQREIWGGWMFEAVYVGDKGYDIEITRNINALPNKYLNLDNSRTAAQNANNTALGGTVANPFFCSNPNASGTGCTSGSALFVGAGATTTRRQLLRPFPNFGDINTSVNEGESWYHSGQLSLTKRFSEGYGLQFAYTKSRWLEATEFLNPADEHPVKQRSPQDTPNRFSMSGFLELPFGRGKRIFSDANRFANMIVGGWQIQGTYVYQTGFPLRFANDLFYLGGDPGLPKDQQRIDRWFNTAAFVSAVGGTPTCGAFPGGSSNCATPVDHLRTFPFFLDEVRIDPINNVDLGLRKDIHLRESMKIQLRVEFINAFNHPLFPAPTVNAGSSGFGAIVTSNQLNYARRAQLAAKFIF